MWANGRPVLLLSFPKTVMIKPAIQLKVNPHVGHLSYNACDGQTPNARFNSDVSAAQNREERCHQTARANGNTWRTGTGSNSTGNRAAETGQEKTQEITDTPLDTVRQLSYNHVVKGGHAVLPIPVARLKLFGSFNVFTLSTLKGVFKSTNIQPYCVPKLRDAAVSCLRVAK